MELRFDCTKNQYVVVKQDILDDNDFMYSTYQQLIRALDEVVRRADHERGAYADYVPSSPMTQDLYLYGNNVIAISGRRGQGKTSAMLSFSDVMAKAGGAGGLSDGPFADHSFVVLDPIDPTVLEANQSPLMLILSRMYRKVEEVWERSLSVGVRTTGQSSADGDRRMLVDQFQRCFSGIREIKSGDGDEAKSLASLHNLSDSSQLKANFYELVCKMLDYCGGRRYGERGFLVIQLDDTDFQVSKGYEVLDDIRKYLTLPNVIILMATDMNLMQNVVAQHFARELGTAIGHNFVAVAEVENNASKYLDKLVPPSQVVHLPSLGLELSRVDTTLRVRLLEGEKPILPAEKEDNLTLESTVLRFLYRKTGILCVSKAGQAHGFVPTTLRGLIQLLNLLSSLEDVPQVPVSAMGKGRHLAYAKALAKRLAVKEDNLRVFEDYFLHTWVNAKFSAEKWLLSASDVQRLLTKLTDETGFDDLCNCLVRELDAPKPDWGKALKEIGFEREPIRSVDVLGQMGRCFIAAVNMAVALRWNKAAVREMRSELPNVERGPENKNSVPYAFKLSHEVTGLPKSFASRRGARPEHWPQDSLGQQIANALEQSREKKREKVNEGITDTMAPNGEFRMLHLVQVMLAMSEDDHDKTLVNLSGMTQREVYESQVAALVIACSPELQTELISVEESFLCEEHRDTANLLNSVREIVERLDDREKEINAGQIGGAGEVPELVKRPLRINLLGQWVNTIETRAVDGPLVDWFLNLFAKSQVTPVRVNEVQQAAKKQGAAASQAGVRGDDA